MKKRKAKNRLEANKLKGNRTNRGRQSKVVCSEDRITIGILYERGVLVKDLATTYGVTIDAIYAILKEEEVVEMRKNMRRASTDRLWIAFERNHSKIDEIMDKYLSEARDEIRIKRTNLPGLFKVYKNVIDSQIRLKELSLKEQEVELKKKLVDTNELDSGMIKDLLFTLGGKNTLKKNNDEEDEE